MPEAHRKEPPRLWVFYPILGGLFLFLALGLGYRQLIQYQDFVNQERQQSLRRILQPGTRGNIVDRNGTLLVGNRPVFSAVVYLSELRPLFRAEYRHQIGLAKMQGQKIDRAKIRKASRIAVLSHYLTRLNLLLGRQEILDEKELERHFAQRLLLPFPLIRDLSIENYALLTERLPVNSPIQIYTDSTRYYPYGSLAAHVLGYVGATMDIPEVDHAISSLRTFNVRGKIGRSGLEKAFDDHLQGKSGEEVWLVDPAGFQCERLKKITPVQGPSLTISLDLAMQEAAEKALGNYTGAIVALDVKTGEVLAMTSHPTYDLNSLVPAISTQTYDAINEKGAWLNRAIQGLYPPGSPFKIITAIAGLRQNRVPPTRQIDCTGGLRVGNRVFPCAKRAGHGVVHLEEAIAHSCNPFFYQLAIDIGPDVLAAEAVRVGLSQPTGIELPFESKRSLVPTPAWKKDRLGESWTQGDTANTAIGQGFLLVTPLQMACFTASLARGDCITHPTLLHNPHASVQHTAPLDLSKADYDRLVRGMEMTVEIGTGKRLQIPGLRIAAKTGTAQVTVKKEPMHLAWCIAFAPIEDPQVAVVTVLEQVDENDRFYGSTLGCPVVRDVLKARF